MVVSLLFFILLILFLSWYSYRGQYVTNNLGIYRKGNDNTPDSDADMQEQYDFDNGGHKKT